MSNPASRREGPRILIIDDDPDTLLALPALLKSRFPHAVVQTAINGDAARTWIRNYRYDVILVDIRMPRIDGLTLLKQLRHELRGARILVMTASHEDLKAQALEAGAYAFHQKPILPDVLIATIRAALRHRSLINL
jgi:DNA-binding response OmpR family regulator